MHKRELGVNYKNQYKELYIIIKYIFMLLKNKS